ncbi:VOC family protein [Paenarthrobacter nicotinovorans]|uniref:VOC family protein n=1 Tax=Paenarthrobacter nicotinovorans TaxID=29320 RepID=UPI00166C6629|nr:VOC family protein [Paenarthrobacter nicotinovorans]MBP2395682.1 putative enzyme related to lactoylglutathione lyase [Paenarthrobacter nicotinovorans]UKE98203.1 VOC family protein [Paenarthrobacter nicotinovorans]UKF02990.1 VOC family protein [Paenarthrobacter nicotinovorans]GGV22724.1 glyoxalase [Paenarthrobacter nicotinovorans]
MAAIVHFEIPTEDTERANNFYRTTFGWNLSPMQGMDYTIALTAPSDEQTGTPKEPGAINGALFPRTDALKTPVLTIDVDDIDAALGQVESAGGSVVQAKNPIPGMGWYGYFKDTEGNVMGVWQTDPSAAS